MPKTNDRAHVINLDDRNRKITHWVSLHIHKNLATFFDSFGMNIVEEDLEEQGQDTWLKVLLHPISDIQNTNYFNGEP